MIVCAPRFAQMPRTRSFRRATTLSRGPTTSDRHLVVAVRARGAARRASMTPKTVSGAPVKFELIRTSGVDTAIVSRSARAAPVAATTAEQPRRAARLTAPPPKSEVRL